MGWLDHKELKIVRGVYIAPGDPNSVEPAIVTLNLLSTHAGFSVTQDGWTPKIPSIKSGGIWADSPITDGRTLIAGVNSNVTETMRLIISGGTYQETAGYLAQLTNMIKDCRDFWQANAQIDPVYLHWFASCGTGRQYALIYNMDFDGEYIDSPTPTIEGTLTIERECYWRAIPPGANPKQWTYEALGQPYDYTKSQINAGTVTFSSSADNRSELNSSGSLRLLVSNNAVTIPAASIPGDAPALMQLIVTDNTGNDVQFVIGKKTREIRQYINVATNNILPQGLIANCNQGGLGVDATTAADTGASQNLSATATRVAVSFATATNQLRLNLPSTLAAVNRYIGRFMVFLRCRQSAGNLGDITMYMRYGSTIALDTDGVKLNVVSPPVIAGTGNTTNWGLVYMGIIQSPFLAGKADINKGGTSPVGLYGESAANDLDLGLFALRSTGTSILYLNDIIFIPVDEGSIGADFGDSTGTSAFIYDETGYFTHGTPDIVARFGLPGGTIRAAKMSGSGIQLTPNIDNKLYIIEYDISNQSVINRGFNVVVALVPRCAGIRGF